MAELDELRIADKNHSGLAEMLRGGVTMDVTRAEQAKIAEDAGATSVMALERVPADIRRDGGVARMASVKKIKEIQKAVSIPVMAKARIGHFVEARILEALAVDFIDESEVLTPADEHFHIDKFAFRVPFVCGARDLGEALRRIGEGAAMIRTKGEAGSGNIVEAVRHMRALTSGIRRLTTLSPEELMTQAQNLGAPHELVPGRAPTGKVLVRKPEELEGVGGLIIPGGESTTLLKLMDEWEFVPAIEKFHAAGKPIFGTCAGLIVLARDVESPRQFSLGLIDVAVERNAYGRQRDSFEALGTAVLEGRRMPVTMVFIRAPRIRRVGAGVETLAEPGGGAGMARRGGERGAIRSKPAPPRPSGARRS